MGFLEQMWVSCRANALAERGLQQNKRAIQGEVCKFHTPDSLHWGRLGTGLTCTSYDTPQRGHASLGERKSGKLPGSLQESHFTTLHKT
jgi:hypothetical protein